MNYDTTATVPTQPDDSGPTLPFCLGARYLLTKRIGAGGMATIYRAYDNHFERDVAVKLMTPKLRTDPEFDARFRREALIVSKLNDPHIIVVHDFGIDTEHGPFLVMELLDGETLRQRLNAAGPLPVPAAIQLGEQLMLALAHAHEHGVIHRDLKPDNVFLIAQSGMKMHVRVLDFGIAVMTRNPNHTVRPNETPRGSAVGTPRYMAPEQHAGKPASERSDLWSAAVVMYEALTGSIPEIMGPRLRRRCPEAPDGLVRLIEQCLNSNPDERPISATEAYLHLHELRRAAGGELLVSESAVAQMTARFRAGNSAAGVSPLRRLWLAAALALTFMIMPLAWFMFFRAPPISEVDLVNDESIDGIRLGDSRDDVVSRLGRPNKGGWESLRPFVEHKHLIKAGDTTEPEVLSWHNGGLEVAVVGNEVRAIVARTSAMTTRRLRIGDNESAMRRAYSSAPSTVTLLRDGSHQDWSTAYYYEQYKLAIHMRAGQVTALALCDQSKP